MKALTDLLSVDFLLMAGTPLLDLMQIVARNVSTLTHHFIFGWSQLLQKQFFQSYQFGEKNWVDSVVFIPFVNGINLIFGLALINEDGKPIISTDSVSSLLPVSANFFKGL